MSATPSTSRPTPRPGLCWAELADATLLVDEEGDALHLLNPLASAIFALCDGLRSGPEIAQALDADLERLSPPHDEVERWISQALDAGYLVARADSEAVAEPVELGLADLHTLARKLRTRGDIELSLRVQTRVAELAGESPEDRPQGSSAAPPSSRREGARRGTLARRRAAR